MSLGPRLACVDEVGTRWASSRASAWRQRCARQVAEGVAAVRPSPRGR